MAETTISRDDILSWVRSASMIELSEVVKAIEEEFGVTASVPMALAGMMPAAGGAAEEVEQTEFDVVLTGHGQQKIQVIRVVREITSLGLKEAKRKSVPPSRSSSFRRAGAMAGRGAGARREEFPDMHEPGDTVIPQRVRKPKAAGPRGSRVRGRWLRLQFGSPIPRGKAGRNE